MLLHNQISNGIRVFRTLQGSPMKILLPILLFSLAVFGQDTTFKDGTGCGGCDSVVTVRGLAKAHAIFGNPARLQVP